MPGLPSRPGSLDQLGVRVGGEWLAKTVLREEAQLGAITHLARRTSTGELVIVGTRAALFVQDGNAAPRLVAFGEPAGHAELVEWPDGKPRFLDRGGGGWRTGALLGTGGERLWQPDRGPGMNDIASGDLDGDGIPEFVVGYNGSGGVRMLDADGRQRWQESDGNVWHVEIVDTDGNDKPEIVHSNASGQMIFRDSNGKVIRRAGVESYFSQFAPVHWPPGQPGFLHVTDTGVDVLDFQGMPRVRLETPDLNVVLLFRYSPAPQSSPA